MTNPLSTKREDVGSHFQILVSKAGSSEIRAYEVQPGDMLTVGRDQGCEIFVPDPRLSRRHGRFESRSDGLFLVDLGSANGCLVNGCRIESARLKGGDVVMLGDCRIVIEEQEGVVDWDIAAIHRRLLERLNLRDLEENALRDASFRESVRRIANEIALADQPRSGDEARSVLVDSVMDEVFGLGPLEKFLADDSVSEIMVNAPDEVWLERGGRLTKAATTFSGDAAVRRVIDRIVAPLGRRLDESSPLVDARLQDGSRVNAVIPPIALKGATLTVRKFRKQRIVPQDLLAWGALDECALEILREAVSGRKNIIVSGGTGAGKTTLLNVLASFIGESERIITIEDAAELQLPQPHVVRLETRPPNLEGRGSISIRDLLKNALRMRPDRIIVGECRGGEALDMLQAMNTGHDGSLSTIHANTASDALRRLETLVLFAGTELPHRAVRDQVASAVHLVVQQSRLSSGKRCVTSITALKGLDSDGYVTSELWRRSIHDESDVTQEVTRGD